MTRFNRPSLLALLVMHLVGASIVLGPLAPITAAGHRAQSAPPDCRYDDVLTARHGYADWPESVLDPIFKLPNKYAPSDLVAVRKAGLSGRAKVRRLVIKDLREMARAARQAHAALAVQSAYRSSSRQASLFSSYARRQGYRRAALISARRGHSEHQLGTTIDFKSKGGRAPWYYTDWARTSAGKWMQNNGWRYGWVMSYPKGSLKQTCYKYEPWHYRYVGRDAAAAIHASGLTTREWLWAQGYSEAE